MTDKSIATNEDDVTAKYAAIGSWELPLSVVFTTQQKATLGIYLARTRLAAEYHNKVLFELDERLRNLRNAVLDGGDIEGAKTILEDFLASLFASGPATRVEDREFAAGSRKVVSDLEDIVLTHYTGVEGPVPTDPAVIEAQGRASVRLLSEGPLKTITRYLASSWDRNYVDPDTGKDFSPSAKDTIDKLLEGLLGGQEQASAQRRRLH